MNPEAGEGKSAGTHGIDEPMDGEPIDARGHAAGQGVSPGVSLDGEPTLLSAAETVALERDALPAFLPNQRWFGAKDAAIRAVSVVPLAALAPGHHLAAVDVDLGVETQRYLLPLSRLARDDPQAPTLVSLDGARLTDSAILPALDTLLLDAMRENQRVPGPAGALVFRGSQALSDLGDPGAPKTLGAEQSNVSIGFGGKVILKLYRRLRAGEQPDVEIARFLTGTARYTGAPPLLGELQLVPERGEPTTLAAAFAFVPNQGDAWSAVTRALRAALEQPGSDLAAPELSVGARLGQRTAEMHRALATDTDDPAFRVEPLRAEDVARWVAEASAEADEVLANLSAGLSRLPQPARDLATRVLAFRDALTQRLRAPLGLPPSGGRSRIHGDYHLGQVLAADGDFVIIDFEGEPRRSLPERRAKSSPLRDAAGMLRSFHYAAHAAADALARPTAEATARAAQWRLATGAAFLDSYHTHLAGAASAPDDPRVANALTDLFLVQKAVYEVAYELANRPAWLPIPLTGLLDLLSTEQG